MGVIKAISSQIDKLVPASLQPMWNHPAGPKTVFFWAPTFKWGLVFAGLADIISRKPADISIPQTISLAATGLIWSRYSLVINPVNYNLFAVNVFVAITQITQMARAIKYHMDNPPPSH
ncbi:uncharacterized protein [Onthophagus taurus]|uniref:uncharacterized protein isoform X4 n=1 Tax=Onthophagus taurus TaxID=166361 RepID=UPI000C2025F8|nr:mitochondrial pyruvate carrier 4-like isoform X4 [Onthophagus taurus]